ncbi:RDD family protein [Mucilaginibacter sp. HMF5004]|uniref:RDD family protein n=1 Tax=Mucilaginibacter rivuli TaxID=2857527 RepID=UPI001C5EC82B|nr:RDD family protein [Mucilaginibacter rivuli]MBW4890983.1 RDD family protein [Mucilaginibacter rivuli]
MASTYVLVINGKPEGPFTIDELKTKGLKPADFVRTDGMDDYKEAHEIAELRSLFGFARQNIMPQYFGSFDERAFAAIIDLAIVAGTFILISVIAMLIIPNQIARMMIFLLGLIVIPLLNFIYHILMEGSAKQATYGKILLKIRVCNEDGSPIDYSKAAARNLAKIVSNGTLFLGYIICFFNKKQQCLHDMIAGTLVMKDRLL